MLHQGGMNWLHQPKLGSWIFVLYIIAGIILLATFTYRMLMPFQASLAAPKPAEGKGGLRPVAGAACPFWLQFWTSGGLYMLAIHMTAAVLSMICTVYWICTVLLFSFGAAYPVLLDDALGIYGQRQMKVLAIVGCFCHPVVCLADFRNIRNHLRQWRMLYIWFTLELMGVAWQVEQSYVSASQISALNMMKETVFWECLKLQFLGLAWDIFYWFFASYLKYLLIIEWRQDVTLRALRDYMSNRKYYKLSMHANDGEHIDNPDQRIQEDAGVVSDCVMELSGSLILTLMRLFSFGAVLWRLSSGLGLLSVGYSTVMSMGAVCIAAKLVELNFIYQRKEADFRYSMIGIRTNAESIAFYRGEGVEQRSLHTRFEAIVRIVYRQTYWVALVSVYTSIVSCVAGIYPPIILAGGYFKGHYALGVLWQAVTACNITSHCAVWLINSIPLFVSVSTALQRLTSLMVPLPPEEGNQTLVTSTAEPRITIRDLSLSTPCGSEITRNLSMDTVGVEPQRMIIVGASGVGKSSLLRVVCGLWTKGSGEVVRPSNDECIFLPQSPYMPLGNLRAQVTYPGTRPGEPVGPQADDSELRGLLGFVRLGHLPDNFEEGFDAVRDWSQVLSLGEQQRLAFARILLRKPKFAILDEATSALSGDDEASLYRLLQERRIPYISVGHNESLLQHHDMVVELKGEGAVDIIPVGGYTAKKELEE